MEKTIIYQVLPRLFGNKNTNRIQNGTLSENGCGKFNDFTPKALQEIKALGTTHIWYTGIIEHATTTDYSTFGIPVDSPDVVKGKAGSPYAIKDYYDVCPDLAEDVNNRIAEFESLVQRTHQEKLKVIIDFIPNHLARHYVSDVKPYNVKDFGEDDDTSKGFSQQNNFYYIQNKKFTGPIENQNNLKWNESPAKVTGNDCLTASPSINDWYETVKLNYGINLFNTRSKHFKPIPDTWKKMLDILLYWSAKNIDGFRCDMAEMVPVEFWSWVIPKVKVQYPQVLFIGEVYNPKLYRLYIKAGFNYLYDKVGMYDTLKYISQGHKSCKAITKAWENIHGIQNQMLFFLENHDEQRIASPYFIENPIKAIPPMIISGAMYKNPLMIYYGQELGEPGMDEEGFSGKNGRTTIFDYWSMDLYQKWVNDGSFNTDQLPQKAKELRNWYQQFLNLISKNEIFNQGHFYDLMWANDNNPRFNSFKTFAFVRYLNKKVLIVVVNFNDEKSECRVKIPAHAFVTLGLENISYFSGHNLLKPEQKISFPKDVAITNGIGMSIEPCTGNIFQLEF